MKWRHILGALGATVLAQLVWLTFYATTGAVYGLVNGIVQLGIICGGVWLYRRMAASASD